MTLDKKKKKRAHCTNKARVIRLVVSIDRYKAKLIWRYFRLFHQESEIETYF